MEAEMHNTIPTCLEQAHVERFGTIVQWYARHELLMQEIIASVTGSDLGSIILLTQHHDVATQMEAVRDLLQRHAVPLNQVDQILAYLTLLGTFAPLHHDILHASWVRGHLPDSIQPDWILRRPPVIEAVREDMHLPRRSFLGRETGEHSFCLEDLDSIARQLATNHAGLSRYLGEIGLVTRNADTQ
jgi:hypothetical protein